MSRAGRCGFAAALLAAAFAGPGAALAADAPRVRCATASAYAGRPLWAGDPEALGAEEFESGGALDLRVAARLDAALDDAFRRTQASGLTAALVTAEGDWSGTRGVDTSKVRRFYWASAGKTLTAIAVLQLVEEGRLALSDPVANWFPDLPNARVITVDHLLTHTAGLFSANEDLQVRKSPRYRTPRELIRIAAKHGAQFCPGEHWRYSNTGYTVLGEIVAAIEKLPYHEAVNRRVGERLGLASLRVLGPRDDAAGVARVTPADGSKPQIQPAWGHAAGGAVATAADMCRLWHALAGGRLLGAATTAAMFERLYPMFDAGTFYGRGVMLYELPAAGGLPARTWIGHSGGTPGAKAIVAFSPADQAFVAVALTGDGPAEAAAHLLLRTFAAD